MKLSTVIAIAVAVVASMATIEAKPNRMRRPVIERRTSQGRISILSSNDHSLMPSFGGLGNIANDAVSGAHKH
ncbi:hypothetical protein BDF22DRAFT_685411, partial [Syncephalis plumigaleata]